MTLVALVNSTSINPPDSLGNGQAVHIVTPGQKQDEADGKDDGDDKDQKTDDDKDKSDEDDKKP